MKETTRIATVEITYIVNEDDLKKRNLSFKSKENHKRDIERFLAMYTGNENIIAKVTNIQDFVMDKDEQEIKFSLNDIERIIEGKKRRLDDLKMCWSEFTRHMECGEIRELEESCIEDEIIIAVLEKFLKG